MLHCVWPVLEEFHVHMITFGRHVITTFTVRLCCKLSNCLARKRRVYLNFFPFSFSLAFTTNRMQACPSWDPLCQTVTERFYCARIHKIPWPSTLLHSSRHNRNRISHLLFSPTFISLYPTCIILSNYASSNTALALATCKKQGSSRLHLCTRQNSTQSRMRVLSASSRDTNHYL